MKIYGWRIRWYGQPVLELRQIKYTVVKGFTPWRINEYQKGLSCFLVEELQWNAGGGRNSLGMMTGVMYQSVNILGRL